MSWGHTSASQIKTFRSCPRKWYRESVLGERQPAGPAALRGQAIHAELEDYLEHGTTPKDGTAQALTRMLPEGGTIPAEQIEVGFLWTPPEWKAPAKGFVDLCLPPNEIIDHKSTASLNYALTEQQARRDPQALIYAGVALAGGLGLSFNEGMIRFRLNYATTRGALKTRSVHVDLSPAEVLDGLDDIGERVVNRQAELSLCGEEWAKIEPDYSACDAFGGCPFRHDCQKLARPVVKEVLTVGNVNSFKEALMRRKAQKEAAPLPSPPPEIKPPQNAFNELDETGAQYERANPPDGLPDGAPLPEKSRPKKRPPRYEGRAISSLKAQELRDAVIAVAAALTEAQRLSVPNGSEPQGTKADNQARLIAMLEIKNNPQSEKAMSQENLFWSIAEEATTEPPPNPPAREVAPPAPVAPPIPTEEPAPSGPQSESPEDEPAPSKWDALRERFLLVDAHCTGAEELEACLRGLIQEIEGRYNMPISVIKYAEGWKELAGLIGLRGWGGCGLPPMVRVDSSSPLWINCSHVMIPLADRVIRGTR